MYENRVLSKFAITLTEDKTTDLEKVLSIWNWMTHNISYDELPRAFFWHINIFRPSAFEILKARKGKCGDISRLFIVLTHSLGYPAHRVYLENEGIRSHVATEVFIIDR